MLQFSPCAAGDAAAANTPAAATTYTTPPPPTATSPLHKLEALLHSSDPPRNQSAALVVTAREVSKGMVGKQQQPPVELAAAAVEALALAAAMAATPLHRGHIMLERSRLLQWVGRVEEAIAASNASAALFSHQLRGRPGFSAAATAPAATTAAAASLPKQQQPPQQQQQALRGRNDKIGALAGLLDTVSLMRQLGNDERWGNALLCEAATWAKQLNATSSYLRSLAQLSVITGEVGGSGAAVG